CSQSTHVPLTF
nr:immunoglobulin light chain junction region [Mus musculus]NSL96988.1 immunoglobulin light chain junction region [Mus musculus]NSL97135.1 immunoglobulin light chain junction region [Mus musculus]NSL98364.1 immunoglobulin light chain junction region [Mus musculus]NSL98866.1 immunoglobulin light chain junction region [Mus musculus]